jgi:hypothetical protein
MFYLVLILACLIIGFWAGRQSQEPLIKKDLEIMEHMSESLMRIKQSSENGTRQADPQRKEAENIPEDEGPLLH